MKRWFWVALFVCAAAGTGWYFLYHSSPAPTSPQDPAPQPPILAAQPSPQSMPVALAPAPSAKLQEPGTATPKVAVPIVAPGPAGEAIPEPEPVGLPPATVLSNMRRTVRQYGEMFGGNPVGTNPEITRALNGDNPRHVKFLKPDGNRVNENGELIDPWGTPYFFHQLSGTEMEIRSAGPDKIMYTGDDLVTK
jgi:hypothetical protein